RAIAWMDQNAGDWDKQIPSWGTSLLLHALALLMLALFVYVRAGRGRGDDIQARFASQLTEDLTSLTPSDPAGDPFTSVKSDEPPSLSLEPAGPEVDTISQPEVPFLSKFAPELAAPEARGERTRTLETTGATLLRRLAPAVSTRALTTVVTR